MYFENSKSNLRKKYLKKRRALSSFLRVDKNIKINNHLKQLKELKNAVMIAAYITDEYEVDIGEVIDWSIYKGSRVYLPKFKDDEDYLNYNLVEINFPSTQLVKGKFGINEPIDGLPVLNEKKYNKLVWLIPGVAFDLKGGRLGRGKGVYDRMLAKSRGIKIGIFYKCQQCAAVPMESHDSLLDLIVTEDGIIRCT